MIIGCDPGISGSLALYDPKSMTIALLDMPTMWVAMSGKTKGGKPKRRRKINYTCLAKEFKKMVLKGGDVLWIEKVHAQPNNGCVQAFSFGESVGAIKSLAAACGLPCYEVPPQVWKRKMDLIGKDKKASVELACSLFGKDLFPLVKDHNKADAALIACYGANH